METLESDFMYKANINSINNPILRLYYTSHHSQNYKLLERDMSREDLESLIFKIDSLVKIDLGSDQLTTKAYEKVSAAYQFVELIEKEEMSLPLLKISYKSFCINI